MKVGLLWRAEWDAVDDPRACKLHGVFAAFAELGVDAEPVVYSDDAVDRVRAQLLELDGVLVWVNPVEQGLDRSRLDPLLREVAAADVFVSAHPDVILRLGTKQVLVDTRGLTWGTDTRAHATPSQLLDRLRTLEGPVVLKRLRGMGGNGVWKVERGQDGAVEVVEAVRDARPERLPVEAFVDRAGAPIVEQPFLPRLAEGMTRVYLTHDCVVGFALQFPRGLLPPSPAPAPAKTFFEAGERQFAELRGRMEREWLPELQRIVDVERDELPVIWDADFVRRDGGGWALLEINCSSTFAFPEHAMPGVAGATVERLA